jgi:hypothetical protein
VEEHRQPEHAGQLGRHLDLPPDQPDHPVHVPAVDRLVGPEHRAVPVEQLLRDLVRAPGRVDGHVVAVSGSRRRDTELMQ